jgi:hypothetical protein
MERRVRGGRYGQAGGVGGYAGADIGGGDGKGRDGKERDGKRRDGKGGMEKGGMGKGEMGKDGGYMRAGIGGAGGEVGNMERLEYLVWNTWCAIPGWNTCSSAHSPIHIHNLLMDTSVF